MTVFDPFRLSRRMFDFDNEFDFDWQETAMDMYEENDNVIIKLQAPGFDEKNVDITIDDRSVTITGKTESSEEEEDKQKKYYRKEISTKSFTRTVSLPTKVVAGNAKAKFQKGILTLTIPKAEEAKPKKIKIEPES